MSKPKSVKVDKSKKTVEKEKAKEIVEKEARVTEESFTKALTDLKGTAQSSQIRKALGIKPSISFNFELRKVAKSLESKGLISIGRVEGKRSWTYELKDLSSKSED